MKKKRWDKPELIVIVRSMPEENVLQACKTRNAPPSGPDSWDDDCDYGFSVRCVEDVTT